VSAEKAIRTAHKPPATRFCSVSPQAMWSGDYGAGLRRWSAWVLAFGGIPSVLGQFNYSRYSHDTWSKVSKSENIFSSRNGEGAFSLMSASHDSGWRTPAL
jgi:hypothetical protein